METTTTRLQRFVQGNLALTNQDALNLIREYRIEMERVSCLRQRESETQMREIHKILEEFSRG